jgi:hypothetical protein
MGEGPLSTRAEDVLHKLADVLRQAICFTDHGLKFYTDQFVVTRHI